VRAESEDPTRLPLDGSADVLRLVAAPFVGTPVVRKHGHRCEEQLVAVALYVGFPFGGRKGSVMVPLVLAVERARSVVGVIVVARAENVLPVRPLDAHTVQPAGEIVLHGDLAAAAADHRPLLEDEIRLGLAETVLEAECHGDVGLPAARLARAFGVRLFGNESEQHEADECHERRDCESRTVPAVVVAITGHGVLSLNPNCFVRTIRTVQTLRNF